jgi:LppX_LprAFG lipoprotein
MSGVRIRRATMCLAVLGVVVALAGCGSGGTEALSIKALQTAAATTAQTESMRFTVDTSIDFGGRQMTLHAEGVSSADGKQAQVTLTSPLTGDLEMRVVDGVVYVKAGDGPLGNLLDTDKPWIRFDAGASEFGGLIDPTEGGTPQAGLELLQSVSGDVETIGDDTVAGRHAVHYRASIDPAKVADLPGREDERGSVPVDVWIDDQDRVVKVQTTVESGMLGLPGVGGSLSLTMEVTEFDVPVDVTPPPDDQVSDIGNIRDFGGFGDGHTI